MGEVDALHWLNMILAALASLAAFGALNKMEWGVTRPCIIGATLLVAIGSAGQWLGLAREEWVRYADTALYGGILAMTIATQRTHTWFLERWANPVASAIAAISFIVLVGGLLAGCTSAAPADKPICGRWQATPVYAEDGTVVAVQLDFQQLRQLHDMVTGLSEGRCRLLRPGERPS